MTEVGDHGDRFDEVLEAFESAWAKETPPNIGDILPPDMHTDGELLCLLCQVDLEYRLKRKEDARVERYVGEFPLLAEGPNSIEKLIRCEYAFRCRHGSVPEAQDYRRRFPNHAQTINELFRERSSMLSSLIPLRLTCPGCGTSLAILPRIPAEETICDSCGSHINVVDAFSQGRTTIPQQVGRYEMLCQVGEGSVGVVWKARDLELQRTVAVKLPRRIGNQEEKERFLREARNTAQLHHPGIVPVLDVGHQDDVAYIVSAFVEGMTLEARMKQKRFAIDESLQLMSTAARAVAHAHSRGVVHRDLKPANIMVDSANIPQVTDFGLAKLKIDEITMTVEGQILGAPAYMSPEQAAGHSHAVDGQSDVFSLGVILYELLTGSKPFTGTVQMVLHQVLEHEPIAPRALNPSVSSIVQNICLKAMSKNRSQRYASASHFAEDIDNYLRGDFHLVKAKPPTLIQKVWYWSKKNRRIVIPVIILFAIVTCFSLYSLQQSRNIARQFREADSGRLAGLSRDYAPTNQLVALKLAIVAVETTKQYNEPVLPLAESTLREALDHTGKSHFLKVGESSPCCYSPDGRWMLATNRDDTLELHDLNVEGKATSLLPHISQKRPFRIAFDQNCHRLALVLNDQVKVWDLSNSLLSQPREFAGVFVPLDNDPPRYFQTLLRASDRRWSSDDFVDPYPLSLNSRWLAVAGGDGISIWDLESTQSAARILSGANRTSTFELSPTNEWLIERPNRVVSIFPLPGSNSPVPFPIAPKSDDAPPPSLLWDLATTDYARKAYPLTKIVASTFGADDAWLLTIDDEQHAELWDLAELRSADASTSAVRHSLDLVPLTVRQRKTLSQELWPSIHSQNATVMLRKDGKVCVWSPTSDSGARFVELKGLNLKLATADTFAATLIPSPENPLLKVSADPELVTAWTPSAYWNSDAHWMNGGASAEHNGIFVAFWTAARAPTVWALTAPNKDDFEGPQLALEVHHSREEIPKKRKRSHNGTKTKPEYIESVSGPFRGEQHGGVTAPIKISGDGRWMVGGHVLWNLSSFPNELWMRKPLSLDESISQSSFSEDCRWLLTMTGEGKCTIWNLSFLNAGQRHPLETGDVLMTTNNKWLIQRDATTMRYWRLESEKFDSRPGNAVYTQYASPQLAYNEHLDSVLSLDAPTYERFKLGHYDQLEPARSWALADEAAAEPRNLGFVREFVASMNFSDDGRWLHVQDAIHGVRQRTWDLSRSRDISTPIVEREGRQVISYVRSSGRWITYNYDVGEIGLWDIYDGELREIARLANESRYFAASRDYRWYVAETADQLVRYDLADSNPQASAQVLLQKPEGRPLAPLCDRGRRLVTMSDDSRRLLLWDLNVNNSPRELLVAEKELDSFAIYQSKDWFVFQRRLDPKKTLHLWRVSSDDPTMEHQVFDHMELLSNCVSDLMIVMRDEHTLLLFDMTATDPMKYPRVIEDELKMEQWALSCDENYLATLNSTGGVRLWNLQDKKAAYDGRLLFNQANVRSIAVDDRGECVVTQDDKGTIRIRRSRPDGSFSESAKLPEVYRSSGPLSINSQGTLLATSGKVGESIRLWRLDITDLLQAARDKIDRPFTDQERKLYTSKSIE